MKKMNFLKSLSRSAYLLILTLLMSSHAAENNSSKIEQLPTVVMNLITKQLPNKDFFSFVQLNKNMFNKLKTLFNKRKNECQPQDIKIIYQDAFLPGRNSIPSYVKVSLRSYNPLSCFYRSGRLDDQNFSVQTINRNAQILRENNGYYQLKKNEPLGKFKKNEPDTWVYHFYISHIDFPLEINCQLFHIFTHISKKPLRIKVFQRLNKAFD